MKKFFLLIGFCVFSGMTTFSQPKKYIGHSWDFLGVTPAEVSENLDALEKSGLDGMTLVIKNTLPSGKKINALQIRTDPKWEKKDVKDQIPLLQKIVRRKKLEHTFLTCFWSSAGRLDWKDDQAWGRFSNNMGVLAWLAKQGKAKGILIDPEDYSGVKQFIRQPADPAFDELSRLARKRGRELFTSVFQEYPDITLLSFWFLSLDPTYITCKDPTDLMKSKGDLWPSFINGMLDVIPPQARFIDGNEHAYMYEASKRDFYYSAWGQMMGLLPLVAPENRNKYKTQLQVGFGLYLDMYTNKDPKNIYYFGPILGSRLFHFSMNLSQATDSASEYIWIYGEKYSWIPWKNISVEKYRTQGTWEDQLPGFTKTLLMTKDPDTFLDQELRAKNLKNVIPNGTCVSAETFATKGYQKGKLPKPYTSWQNETKRQGSFGIDTSCGEGDSSSLCAIGVEHGCFCVDIFPVIPGQRYIFQGSAKGRNVGITVSWMKDGKWQWQIPSVNIPAKDGPEDQWRKARGMFSIPEGVDKMVLLLEIKQTEHEKAWYDNIQLYPIQFR